MLSSMRAALALSHVWLCGLRFGLDSRRSCWRPTLMAFLIADLRIPGRLRFDAGGVQGGQE